MEVDNQSSSESEFESTEARRLVRAVNRKKKKSGGFQSMGLSNAVFRGITRVGYKVPTPIQRKTIPMILNGADVVAMARTGSGKTAAFLIPLFEKLKQGAGGAMGSSVELPAAGGGHATAAGARALIMSPTRELALQTLKFAKDLGTFTGLRTALVLGGDSMDDQFDALHRRPDIIVATPGRFLHVVMEMSLRLSSVEYVVFDEADRLFEMGFASQLLEIISRLPDGRQTVLFSATLPGQLVEFAKAGLHRPKLIRLDVDAKLSPQLRLSFVATRAQDKPAALLNYLRSTTGKKGSDGRPQQTVVFAATKHHVEMLESLLESAGLRACSVYSSLHPTARKVAVGKFRHGKVDVMLVTDLAARGIDIPSLDRVVNFHFPARGKLFVHRVGRVARAGRSGEALSLVAPDELPYLLDMLLFVDKPLTVAEAGGEGPTGEDAVFGRVPQYVIDAAGEELRAQTETSYDLRTLAATCDNAYKQYLRSRPKASPESSKRAKKLSAGVIGPHPMYADGEDKRGQGESLDADGGFMQESYMDAMKTYRPKTTIFEINPTSKSVGNQVMKARRAARVGAIASANRAAAVAPYPTASKRSTEGSKAGDGPTTGVSSFKDEEYFVPYVPANFNSEKGLSVQDASFDQQAAGSTFELEGDEGKLMRQASSMRRWDRKKKKFVTGDSGGGGGNKKKMVTESGHVIPASYKSNFYKDWLGKSKANEGGEAGLGGEDGQQGGGGKGGRPGRMQVFGHRDRRHVKGSDGDRLRKDNRKELKNKDQILKARKAKAKQMFHSRPKKGKGGKGRPGGGGSGGGGGGSFGKGKRGGKR